MVNTMSMKETFESLIAKFNGKVESDPKLAHELDGITKKVNIDLKSEHYSFMLKDARAQAFADGHLDDADVTIISDPETVQGLLDRRIRPMKAFALKKVRIKGSIEDVMHLRKLF
jgi:putative sterol carrier protein